MECRPFQIGHSVISLNFIDVVDCRLILRVINKCLRNKSVRRLPMPLFSSAQAVHKITTVPDMRPQHFITDIAPQTAIFAYPVVAVIAFNWFDWKRDGKEYPKIHPSQKPISVLKRLIETFTDPGDVVIDPCAGSGSTLRAARELGRNSYGFEVSRDFYRKAKEQMLGEEAIG